MKNQMNVLKKPILSNEKELILLNFNMLSYWFKSLLILNSKNSAKSLNSYNEWNLSENVITNSEKSLYSYNNTNL